MTASSWIYPHAFGFACGNKDRTFSISCTPGAAVTTDIYKSRFSCKRSGMLEGAGRSMESLVKIQTGILSKKANEPPICVLPVGGLGEIGMNCMLLGSKDHYILIDAGIMFPGYEELGVKKVIPDTSFIRQWSHKIEAVVITHGHEDHIGALPWVIPALDSSTPIFASSFTMELIKQRLKVHGIFVRPRLHIFKIKEKFIAGPFEVEPISVTHSIPDCCALVLRCDEGTVLHTGDWKIDESPIDGHVFDRAAFEQLSKEGVTLMMSDSTNIFFPGRSPSEKVVADALLHYISSAKGRVITTQFASNIHRLISVKRAADLTGRKLVCMGKSLMEYLDAAWRDGKAPIDPSTLVKAEDINNYAPKDLVMVTTGSQAEPHAALTLASYGRKQSFKLLKEDIILYSARVIPINDTRVMRMLGRLAELGPTVVMGMNNKLHTTGHAFRGELEEVLQLVKPQHFLPIHGNIIFLKEHEELGRSTGVQHTAVIKNGEMVGVSHLRNDRVLSDGFVSLGKEKLQLMYTDGDRAFGTSEELHIGQRWRIANDGIVIVRIKVTRPGINGLCCAVMKGKVRIVTRCLWLDRGSLVDILYRAVHASLYSCPPDCSLAYIEHAVATVLKSTVQKHSGRRPDVVAFAEEDSTGTHFPSSRRDVDSHMQMASSFASAETNPPFRRCSDGFEQSECSDWDKNSVLPGDLHSKVEDGLLTPLQGLCDSRIPRLSFEGAELGMSDVCDKGSDISKIEFIGRREDIISKTLPAAPKSTMRSEWKAEEIRRLIKLLGELDGKFEVEKRRVVFWEQISCCLLKFGVNRTPVQCQCFWISLVEKFEATRAGKGSQKWPYFDDMNRILAVHPGATKA